ncbi:RNase A-like domain-containing protein [Streptomyces sp. NPDC029044]|uniref:RNase A-like domain-containing protein n=1 Tax=Streptomyces sp. NPDC029044 TaxID=3157198 RepID=UPI0033FC0990
MLTRSASYPDRETAHWATQQVVTANEQVIHRWLAQGTRARLTIEAAWPSREEPVGRVQLEGDCRPPEGRHAFGLGPPPADGPRNPRPVRRSAQSGPRTWPSVICTCPS